MKIKIIVLTFFISEYLDHIIWETLTYRDMYLRTYRSTLYRPLSVDPRVILVVKDCFSISHLSDYDCFPLYKK